MVEKLAQSGALRPEEENEHVGDLDDGRIVKLI